MPSKKGQVTLEQVIKRIEKLEKKLETKLDILQEAIISMARTEERVVHLMEKDADKNKRISKLENEISELKETQNISKGKLAVLWIALTSLAGGMGTLIIHWAKGLIQ